MHHQPNRPLPDKLRHELSSPPQHGEGVHNWLFTMSLKLHRYRVGTEIESLLTAAVRGCGREVPPAEIKDAVFNSGALAGRERRDHPRSQRLRLARPKTSRWPEINQALRDSVTSVPFTLRQLADASPIPIEAEVRDSSWYVRQLYEDDDLLCIGTDPKKCFTTPCFNARLLLDGKSMIVPSPMSESYGLTKCGKHSMRCLSNSGPRRYLVTEFDNGTQDEQAALIRHLSQFGRLVMVLSSGGKSLHAWWRCADTDEAGCLRFFRYAVTLGADPAMWTRCQLARLPEGWRADKETWQQVYYFDPANACPGGGTEPEGVEKHE